MFFRRLTASILGAAMLAASTATTLVATTGAASAQNAAICDAYARDYANWRTGNPYGAAVVGGAVGAIFGAVIGEIIADRPGAGAIIGGGIGAGAAAAAAGPEWQAIYNIAYQNCMAGTPLPYPGNVNYSFNGGTYPAGSPEWMDWCEANLSTFDPWTGTYLASDNRTYYCVVP